MNKVLDVAGYIIEQCNKKDISISNLKLQKLLYFVQVFFALNGKEKPCFKEDIQAWDFGPVVPEAYQKYRVYGGAGIPSYRGKVSIKDISDSDKKIIDQVIEECGRYAASTLVEITHGQPPWINAYEKGRNSLISYEAIRDYFTSDEENE